VTTTATTPTATTATTTTAGAKTGLDVQLHGAVGTLAVNMAFRAAGAPLVIVGPNGAGKTQALMMILGASRPRGGHVTLDGTPLYDAARGLDVPVEQRRIGFLPQRYALFPHLDVLSNVGYGIAAPSRVERRRLAREALAELDAEALAARRPAELSGGETQRVALARALAARPRALLLDEPLAALDVAVRRDTRRFLVERLRAWALPTVVVTHDRADAEAFDGDVVVIERGAVAQRGRLDELGAHPATEFVRQFVSGGAP
jgi:molybdate transport system ATP-binding protein